MPRRALRRPRRVTFIQSLADFPVPPKVPDGFRYCWTHREARPETEFDTPKREICSVCLGIQRHERAERPDRIADEARTPEALMLRYRETGDAAAFRDVVSLATPTLRKYLASRVPSASVGDVAQETWVRAMRAPYHPDGSFLAWLRTIAACAVADFYAQQSRENARLKRKHVPDNRFDEKTLRYANYELRDTLTDRMQSAIPLHVLTAEESVQVLDAAIDSLPSPQAEAIRLASQGWSIREIATRQNVPENTVKTRLRLGREALSEMDLDLEPDRDPQVATILENAVTPGAPSSDNARPFRDRFHSDRSYTPSTLGGSR